MQPTAATGRIVNKIKIAQSDRNVHNWKWLFQLVKSQIVILSFMFLKGENMDKCLFLGLNCNCHSEYTSKYAGSMGISLKV